MYDTALKLFIFATSLSKLSNLENPKGPKNYARSVLGKSKLGMQAEVSKLFDIQ